MSTMIELLGIDRMTVAERKALVHEIWISLPEVERTLVPAATPAEAVASDEVPAPRRITPEEAAERMNNFVPRDEFERLLVSLGKDCGVSLSDEALSSEGIYD